MVDTNGYNIIQDAAKNTKRFVEEGLWLNATKSKGITQYIIRKQTGNIDSKNILTKVAPLFFLSSRNISNDISKSQGTPPSGEQ